MKRCYFVFHRYKEIPPYIPGFFTYQCSRCGKKYAWWVLA